MMDMDRLSAITVVIDEEIIRRELQWMRQGYFI